MMPEEEPDLITCYICEEEFDPEGERPCDCCYDCECMDCSCCDECGANPEHCQCHTDDMDDERPDLDDVPPVRPLRKRQASVMSDAFRVLNPDKQRFGIEVEVSDLQINHVRRANAIYQHLPIKDVYTTQKFFRVVDDGSIRGDDKGELVSIPVSFDDHYNLLLACTLGSEDARDFDWVALSRKSQAYKLKLLESMQLGRTTLKSNQDDYNEFSTLIPNASSWYNVSCGMHITTCQMAASPLTWVKLCHFLNNCSSTDYISLGGRESSQYLRQRPHNMRHFAHAFRGHAGGFVEKYSPLNFKFSQGLMEFRLFRSSTNPIRILSNMQMTQVWLAYFSQCPMKSAPHVTGRHIGAYLAKHKHVYPFAAWAMQQPVHEMVAQGFRQPNVSLIPFTP